MACFGPGVSTDALRSAAASNAVAANIPRIHAHELHVSDRGARYAGSVGTGLEIFFTRSLCDMVDPTGPIVAAAAANDPASKEAIKVASEIVSDLVRPSSQVIGRHWAGRLEDWLESRNARRVLRLAKERVDRKAPTDPEYQSTVTARTAAAILDGAVFADDEIMAEYLSGVLAASRDAAGSDRGQPWASLIGRMSSEQLRLHFVIYGLLRRFLEGRDLTVPEVMASWLFIPFNELNPVMGWVDGDGGLVEAFYGLHREGLVASDDFHFGSVASLVLATGRAIPGHGLIVKPSRAGVGLFLWGLGQGGEGLETIANSAAELSLVEAESPISAITTASLVEQLPLFSPDYPKPRRSSAGDGQRQQPSKKRKKRK